VGREWRAAHAVRRAAGEIAQCIPSIENREGPAGLRCDDAAETKCLAKLLSGPVALKFATKRWRPSWFELARSAL